MKRTLLALACSTLFVGAAHAEYSIYGLLDGSFGKSIFDDQKFEFDSIGMKVAKKAADAGFHSGGDGGSGEGNSTTRVGIKGSTDVGSGIKANFKFETGGIGSDGKVNGDGTFFNRQAWFGFSGGFGEVRLGRQDSIPFQTFIDYDYNGASNGISSAAYSGAGLWALLPRQSGSLQYISPAVGGVKVQLGVQLKPSVKSDWGLTAADKEKDVISGGVTYAAGPLSLSVGFQTKASKDYNDYFGLAGGYDFGVAKVTVGYHDAKDVKGINVGGQVTVAGVNFGAIYNAQTKNNGGDKGSAFELFVNKEVLKGTYAYAEVGVADKKTALGKGTGFAVGMIYTF